MTLSEIEVCMRDADAAWHGPDGEPMMNPNMPTEVAAYRATLEVAYQLAILNEQIGNVVNNQYPQLRVMVEPGNWPIQTQEQKR